MPGCWLCPSSPSSSSLSCVSCCCPVTAIQVCRTSQTAPLPIGIYPVIKPAKKMRHPFETVFLVKWRLRWWMVDERSPPSSSLRQRYSLPRTMEPWDWILKYSSSKALVISLNPKSSVQSVVCTASLPVGPLHSPRLTVPPSFRHSSWPQYFPTFILFYLTTESCLHGSILVLVSWLFLHFRIYVYLVHLVLFSPGTANISCASGTLRVSDQWISIQLFSPTVDSLLQ